MAVELSPDGNQIIINRGIPGASQTTVSLPNVGSLFGEQDATGMRSLGIRTEGGFQTFDPLAFLGADRDKPNFGLQQSETPEEARRVDAFLRSPEGSTFSRDEARAQLGMSKLQHFGRRADVVNFGINRLLEELGVDFDDLPRFGTNLAGEAIRQGLFTTGSTGDIEAFRAGIAQPGFQRSIVTGEKQPGELFSDTPQATPEQLAQIDAQIANEKQNNLAGNTQGTQLQTAGSNTLTTPVEKGMKIPNVTTLNSLAQQGLTENDIIRIGNDIFLKPGSQFQQFLVDDFKLQQEKKIKEEAQDIANQTAQKAFEEFKSSGEGDSDVRESTKLINELFEKAKTGVSTDTSSVSNAPQPPSLAEQFTKLRQDLGVEPLENEIANIDSQIETIQTNLQIEADKIGEQLVAQTDITRQKGALQREAENRIAQLQNQRNSVARILNNKLSSIETIMGFTQQDFQNASTLYNQEFSRQVQMINLVSGAESREIADAKANLNTITNMMSASGVTFDQLNPSQQQHFRAMEVQAGLPSGTLETYLNQRPKAKILSTSSGTDANGNGVVTFIYEGEDGKPGHIEVVQTGSKKTISSSTNTSSGDKPLKLSEIKNIEELYGFTPPPGTTMNQVEQFMKDNPGAPPAELQAGIDLVFNPDAAQENTGTQLNARTAEQNIRDRLSVDELKKIADAAGASSFFRSKAEDVNVFFAESSEDELLAIVEALDSGASASEIAAFL